MLDDWIKETNSSEIKEGLKVANKLADLICFHARCRENGESLLNPFHLIKRKNIDKNEKLL